MDRMAYLEQRRRRSLVDAGLTQPEATVQAAEIHADAVTDQAARAAGDIRGTGTLTKYRPTAGWYRPGGGRTSGSPVTEAAAINAAAHAYAADRQLEGTKYKANAEMVDPNTGQPYQGYAGGGAVGTVGKPILVGEKGPEIFVPKSPGTVIPNKSLAYALPRMEDGGTVEEEENQALVGIPQMAEGGTVNEAIPRWLYILRQKQQQDMARTMAASAPHARDVALKERELNRTHNQNAFNAQVEALYPGEPDEKGKVRISPEAAKLRNLYGEMAQMDPAAALAAVKGGMELNKLISSYRGNPEKVNAIPDLPPDIRQRLLSGEPAAVLQLERAKGNQAAANLSPGLLFGQPTPSGQPGLTAPGHPDSTPGIHRTAAGDTYRVTVAPDGRRTEELIARAPSQEQLAKWREEYASTPEGQLPPNHMFGADGKTIYVWNKEGVPTLASPDIQAAFSSPTTGAKVTGAPAAPASAPEATPAPGMTAEDLINNPVVNVPKAIGRSLVALGRGAAGAIGSEDPMASSIQLDKNLAANYAPPAPAPAPSAPTQRFDERVGWGNPHYPQREAPGPAPGVVANRGVDVGVTAPGPAPAAPSLVNAAPRPRFDERIGWDVSPTPAPAPPAPAPPALQAAAPRFDERIGWGVSPQPQPVQPSPAPALTAPRFDERAGWGVSPEAQRERRLEILRRATGDVRPSAM